MIVRESQCSNVKITYYCHLQELTYKYKFYIK